jgi:hypothetical protein
MDWDDLEQEMVEEGPDTGVGVELGSGPHSNFGSGFCVDSADSVDTVDSVDSTNVEELLHLDEEPVFDSYEDYDAFRTKHPHLYVNRQFVGSGGLEKILSQVGKSKERKKRRSSEEVSRDLIGRFVVDLNWVPCRSTVDNVFSKELKHLWCVKSLVMLREKGVCRICGDRVRGNTWKVVKLMEEERWSTDNCYLVCSQCAMCKGSRYFEGSGVGKMKEVKTFVLKRRRKGYGGSGRLSMYGRSVLKALLEEKEVRVGRVHEGSGIVKQLVNMPRR